MGQFSARFSCAGGRGFSSSLLPSSWGHLVPYQIHLLQSINIHGMVHSHDRECVTIEVAAYVTVLNNLCRDMWLFLVMWPCLSLYRQFLFTFEVAPSFQYSNPTPPQPKGYYVITCTITMHVTLYYYTNNNYRIHLLPVGRIHFLWLWLWTGVVKPQVIYLLTMGTPSLEQFMACCWISLLIRYNYYYCVHNVFYTLQSIS